MRVSPHSLRLRLILGATLCVTLALVAAGGGLQRIFADYVTAVLYDHLEADLDELAGRTEIDEAGTVSLSAPLSDPLFQRPLSGQYWMIEAPDGKLVLRSRSLWDEVVHLPLARETSGALVRGFAEGPGGQPLMVVQRWIVFPENETVLRLVMARDERVLRQMMRDFARTLTWSLGVLGVALIGAVAAQVAYGLRPLRRLRTDLAAVRRGTQDHLEGHYPDEIAPLVEDLNALLHHNSRMVEGARTQAGNLAHALKTPLAVIANEADVLAVEGKEASAEVLHQHVALMRRQVDVHLARARAQAVGESRGGSGTPVMPSLERLVRTMRRLHDKEVFLQAEAVPDFKGDAQTLEEILGNLMDNAGKWAATQMRVGAWAVNDRLVLCVEDDGPGIPTSRLSEVLRRGRRLDESKPGSGLGLAIVEDLVQAYGGEITLDTSSDLGGLRVRVTLPTHPSSS